ncbi:hypothetical protein NKH77_24605 [Streptomyces sp. M19]
MIDGSYLALPDGRLHLLYSLWEGGTRNLYAVRMSDPGRPPAPRPVSPRQPTPGRRSAAVSTRAR